MELAKVRIIDDELMLDGQPIHAVEGYALTSVSGNIATLELTMAVDITDATELPKGQHWRLSVQAKK